MRGKRITVIHGGWECTTEEPPEVAVKLLAETILRDATLEAASGVYKVGDKEYSVEPQYILRIKFDIEEVK